jgi:hypothetical protein
MNAANRQPKVPSTSRRRRQLRPNVQGLESRTLLTAIDLVNVVGTVDANGNPIPPGPYGIIEAGQQTGGGAGWQVAEVGDVNDDGFDDFLVGSPTVNPTGATSPNGGSFPIIGTGNNGQAFLVFGSRQVNVGTFDFRNLFPSTVSAPPVPAPNNQRAGDLGGLGTSIQTNPITGQAGFAFDGLTFVSGQNPGSALGASVAGVGDVNGDNIPDLMIGAPGSFDANGSNAGTGRAYLIYGSPVLSSRTNKTVDLDNPSANGDLNILTFTNTGQNNANSGYSVAGIGDWITDGFADVAIGAPGASLGLAGQGAVYVISGASLRPARTETIALQTVGQTGSTTGGFILTGTTSGDATGFSVAGAGNTTGRTTPANQPIGDLVIGAPDFTPQGVFNGTGSAFLFYGDSQATLNTYVVTANNLTTIPLANLGTSIPGAVFNGDDGGFDQAGYAVSTAGDFNADGLSDFLIGSPGWDDLNPNVGRASLIFGQAASNDLSNAIVGSFSLSTLPVTIAFVEFDGATFNALAGFSVTATGDMNNDQINEIALGSPGINGGAGQAYVIPGNPDLFGIVPLSTVEASNIAGLVISAGQFAGQPNTPSLLGSSVSGNLFLNRFGQTLDGDAIGDLIVGATAFSLNSSRAQAGAAFALEGVFLPVNQPTSNAITVQIGVDQPFGPFVINATTPADLLIFVFSDATLNPPFQPLSEIDPSTVVVNGVAFPNATIGPTTPADLNGDGIPDAVITISPRSNLGLTTNTRTLTFNARTLDNTPNANRRITGSAAITVTGATPGGGGLGSNRNALLGLGNVNAAVPPFGSRLVPNPAILAKLRWKRISPAQTFRQFLPQAFFAGRFKRFYHGPKDPNVLPRSRKTYTGYRTTTLGTYVFARSKYPASGVIDARRIHGITHGARRS